MKKLDIELHIHAVLPSRFTNHDIILREKKDKSAEAVFHGARQKLSRAKRHIEEIRNWERNFLEEGLDSARANFDPQNPTRLIDVKWPESYVHESLGPLIGDAVHNLRSALDLVACEIVGRRGGDYSHLYFPLADSKSALLGNKDYLLITQYAPHLESVILDEIRPFKDGGECGFFSLNLMDRIDKHRMLVAAAVKKSGGNTLIRDENVLSPTNPGGVYRVLDDDGKDVPLTIGSAAYEYNKRFGYPHIEIRFGKSEPREGELVVPTLQDLFSIVENTVTRLAKPEFAALSVDLTADAKEDEIPAV